jgi:PAS domain S-box-containing protein
MKQIKNLKIKFKLIAIILSITVLALAVGFTIVTIYEKNALKKLLIHETKTITRIIGESMTGILSFGEPDEGKKNLHKLMKEIPPVNNVIIYDEKDVLYCQYKSSQEYEMDAPNVVGRKESVEIAKKYIEVYQTILIDGKRIGTVYLRYSTSEIDKLTRELLLVLVILIFFLTIVSLFLAAKLQGIISKPILNLVDVNKKVSTDGNYSVRVNKAYNDEVGMLYDSFNDMMEQIYNRDIYRDKVQDDLKAAEFFLSSIMESMPSSLITIDSNGFVTNWNISAVELTGIDAVEAKEKSIWQLLPGFSIYKETINDVFNTQRTRQFYKELIKINNNTFYLNVTVFPLLAGQAPKLVIMINNVTEIELKEQQLRQSQKMETVGTLAGGLAHDFNNVLGGIIGTISLFKYKTSNNREVTLGDVEKYFTTIEESAARASDMVQHLLSLTRKQELSFAPTDLNDVIKGTVKICKNTFDKSIDINAWYSDEKAMTYSDATQIEQCMLNLCINAAHAMTIMKNEGDKFGGILSISLEEVRADKFFFKLHPGINEAESYWVISVQDTGVGMNSQTVAKIFDPFFTTKGEGKGTGLGLAMVYNIIKQHKGFIDVHSKEGIGSTFNIYLPVLKSIALEKQPAINEAIHHGQGVILVIDDEEVMRQTAQSILEECGYKVMLASDGREGVEMFEKHQHEIDVAVLDMVMPRMSGKQAFIEIKKINSDAKVLLASGFKQDARVESIIGLGVKGFIQKPYGLVKLANSIYKIINES